MKSYTSEKKLYGVASDVAHTALCVSLIAVCSWISVPLAVPFTMQTFAVFLTALMLGGKRGAAAVCVYILLGALGLPVFSGFGGGAGVLLGATGGYIVGFIPAVLISGFAAEKSGHRTLWTALGMVAGLLVCYAFGTAWFMQVYTRANGPVALTSVLGWCVFPFILPDALKIALAILVSRRAETAIRHG
ncbi:MAG: biotin transporter BioY [Oscillospiraceae bacterium]